MSLTTQYTLILAVYFAVLLSGSAWVNRRLRSSKDYFIARGKLGPATIGFSFSATQMSGSSYMGAIGSERLIGYGFSPGGVSSAAAPWFAYVLMGSRLRRVASRLDCTTLVDVFEARYYSRWVNLLPTGIMLVAFIPLIAAQ